MLYVNSHFMICITKNSFELREHGFITLQLLYEIPRIFSRIQLKVQKKMMTYRVSLTKITQSHNSTLVKQSGTLFQKAKRKNGFSMLHLNMRSLPKNLSLLEDFITTVEEAPEIIAISETKSKENNIHNISIPGYSFINTNSRTAAGGVAIYIANELDFFRRRDIELSGDNIESCWVEIRREKLKNVVIGCIYRHPLNDRQHFLESLREQLENLNNKGKEVFILGDINIDFLKYNDDNQTSEYRYVTR